MLGAVNQDFTIFERTFGEPGEEVPVVDVKEYPGGKGANVAVAVSKIFEGSVALVGAVGKDRAGEFLLDDLRASGVNVAGVARLEGAQTGRAFIIVDSEGRKFIHTHFGANDAIPLSHLDSRYAGAALTSSAVAVIVDPPVDISYKAAAMSKNAGARIVFSPGVRVAEGEQLDQILRIADDLVVDRTELTKLAGREEPLTALKILSQKFPELTIVATLGPEGSILSDRGRTTTVEPVDLSALGLKAVNSTGSGDAFLAAYVCYSLSGEKLDEAAKWGNLAGALKASREETRGSPSKEFLVQKSAELAAIRGRRRASRSSKV